ncbi:MAG TPA: MarR family transcriptional regulator [Thermoanaerobaculia bacterium]|nr:MarR family transcriptional regulator [Thermoanaerobaculia bacterium]
MSIQREIKQGRPFAAATQEATVAVLRTADLMRRSLAEVLDPFDITLQQYNVLRILRGAGADGLPTLEIAERMIEQTPGITRLIDRLELKRLVTRVRCETDRRQVFCHITEEGLQLLSKLERPIRDAEDQSLSTLSESELAQLIALLEKARNGLHAALIARREVSDQEVRG